MKSDAARRLRDIDEFEILKSLDDRGQFDRHRQQATTDDQVRPQGGLQPPVLQGQGSRAEQEAAPQASAYRLTDRGRAAEFAERLH